MLFMNPERSAVSELVAAICKVVVCRVRARTLASWSTTPEICKAREMIRTAATVITAGCPKPEKACSAGTMPSNTDARSATTATMS